MCVKLQTLEYEQQRNCDSPRLYRNPRSGSDFAETKQKSPDRPSILFEALPGQIHHKGLLKGCTC